MPSADEKSVPVFFNDCIAARTPWTMATHDTSEKTMRQNHEPGNLSERKLNTY